MILCGLQTGIIVQTNRYLFKIPLPKVQMSTFARYSYQIYECPSFWCLTNPSSRFLVYHDMSIFIFQHQIKLPSQAILLINDVFVFLFTILCCKLLWHWRTNQMVQTETIMTGIVDHWTSLALNWKRRLATVIVVCCIGCIIGIPSTTQVVMESNIYIYIYICIYIYIAV